MAQRGPKYDWDTPRPWHGDGKRTPRELREAFNKVDGVCARCERAMGDGLFCRRCEAWARKRFDREVRTFKQAIERYRK